MYIKACYHFMCYIFLEYLGGEESNYKNLYKTHIHAWVKK